MPIIALKPQFEQFTRMFEVRIKKPDLRLNFKFYPYPDGFREIVTKTVEFIACELCDKEMAYFDSVYTAGAYLCSDCKKEYVSTCSCCQYTMIDISDYPRNYIDKSGARIKHNKTVRFNGKEQYICSKCDYQRFVTCDSCKVELFQNEARMTDGAVFCAECAKDKLKQCNSCHALVLKEQLINGQCNACFIRSNSQPIAPINGYGHKPKPVFISLKSSGMLPYYGLEVEMDGGNRSNSLLRQLARFKEIYLKTDGSLSRMGLELVTYPLNLEYHREFMNWHEIFSICESDGYKSHDTNNCGLHIHIGRNAFGESKRNQSKYLAFFLRLFMKFSPQIAKFSRRSDFGYCHFYSGYNLNDKSTRAYQSYVYHNNHNRNLAVNFLNENTVEIRVFKGTLNKITLLAAIGLLDALIKLSVSVKTEEKLNAIQWNDIRNFAIPELITYLDKKRL